MTLIEYLRYWRVGIRTENEARISYTVEKALFCSLNVHTLKKFAAPLCAANLLSIFSSASRVTACPLPLWPQMWSLNQSWRLEVPVEYSTTIRKLDRWGMALQELDLEIRCHPGKQNANADGLSKSPLSHVPFLMELLLLWGGMWSQQRMGNWVWLSNRKKNPNLVLLLNTLSREFYPWMRQSHLSWHYWWPGMRANIAYWNCGCLMYATRKVGRPVNPPPPSLTLILVEEPFDREGVWASMQ